MVPDAGVPVQPFDVIVRGPDGLSEARLVLESRRQLGEHGLEKRCRLEKRCLAPRS